MKHNKILTIGDKQYKVYLTSDDIERKRGLMGLDSISDDWGILFEYDTPNRYGIWMKDTKIPLDVVWIDENKIIITKKTLYPYTINVVYPENNCKYILEVNANTFDGKVGESILLENLQ